MFGEVVKLLQDQRWLSEEKTGKEPDALVDEAFKNKLLKGTQLNNILEFSRCVHAEMAAICEAARRGVSIRGATLYSTTFPCHGCAKHIVAAGISRVVFIEPFPKSLVVELHHDSIAVDDPSPPPGMVRFDPFVGISPRRYMDLFSVDGGRRKNDDGTRSGWEPSGAPPRLPGYFPTLDAEDVFFKRFQDKLVQSGLQLLWKGGEQRLVVPRMI
jgi:tRNA(Arg) A34 adenosine deaminase TadA